MYAFMHGLNAIFAVSYSYLQAYTTTNTGQRVVPDRKDEGIAQKSGHKKPLKDCVFIVKMQDKSKLLIPRL